MQKRTFTHTHTYIDEMILFMKKKREKENEREGERDGKASVPASFCSSFVIAT